ncbi:MAG TPA: hypothetical protein GX510_10060 [Firmicutes bacterium]|nr:hypothetical protein [Candidatus Fermentithermobacillaceae bacterium]
MKPVFRNEEELKNWVSVQIAGPIDERIWALCKEDGFIDEALNPEFRNVKGLLKRYRDLENLKADRRPTERKPRQIPPDKRLATLSEIIAIEAARLPEVVRFREEVLSGQLIPFAEIPTWIEQKAKEDGGGTHWVEIPLPPGHELPDTMGHLPPEWLRRLADTIEKHGLRIYGGWRLNTLSYPGPPGENWVRAIPVRHDGVLGRLKRIAGQLCRRYPAWEEARAVAFVLSGAVPLIPKARLQFDHHSHMPPTITITVDPRLSKEEVAKLYARHRRELFEGQDKPMSEKHLKLAVFLAQNPSGTWVERMSNWNACYPQWSYTNYRTFCRDALAAYERVRGNKFDAQEWEPQAKAMLRWAEGLHHDDEKEGDTRQNHGRK